MKGYNNADEVASGSIKFIFFLKSGNFFVVPNVIEVYTVNKRKKPLDEIGTISKLQGSLIRINQ
ncbi:hypothetical protein BK142_23540 [Paenibacillus glucanolyticus]|nr:hypothetical protein BK142_23540 [Paenibacillus glucanolyticus]